MNDDIKLSKKMSFALRHGAKKLNIKMSTDGFVKLQDILQMDEYTKRFSEADILRIVETNDKKRFAIKEDPNGILFIKAVQGHSLEVPDLELIPVLSSKDVGIVVHGTNKKALESIQREGLKIMNRIHIHFSVGLPEDDGIISGMRRDCSVFIYIDIDAAIRDGIPFFRSSNNVILSPGNQNGVIEPKYFKNIVIR